MQRSKRHSGQAHYEHWEEKFISRPWGRYPPEDLVRTMGRAYANVDHQDVSVLEVGCGPGANLWFLHREGYEVAGIDSSPSAILLARERLETENAGLNRLAPDLRVGDFSVLPWEDNRFDHVIDVFAIYANTLQVIDAAVSEIHRVLRPGGRFYSKLWGRNTTGFGTGVALDARTFDDIAVGPCAGMGISHFFDRHEIMSVFSKFEIGVIDVVNRTDVASGWVIEEYLCQFTKSAP